MIKFPEFLEELLNAGIEVTIRKHHEYGVAYDLNVRAKSHMDLVWDPTEESWAVLMRYNEKFLVDGIDDLKYRARYAMHGRSFIDSKWAEFLEFDYGNV